VNNYTENLFPYLYFQCFEHKNHIQFPLSDTKQDTDRKYPVYFTI